MQSHAVSRFESNVLSSQTQPAAGLRPVQCKGRDHSRQQASYARLPAFGRSWLPDGGQCSVEVILRASRAPPPSTQPRQGARWQHLQCAGRGCPRLLASHAAHTSPKQPAAAGCWVAASAQCHCKVRGRQRQLASHTPQQPATAGCPAPASAMKK